MDKRDQSPFYKRLSFNLISLALICLALVYGKPVLLPIFFAILFANLLLPIVNFSARKGLNRVLSILIPLFLSIVIGCTVVFLLSSQVSKFFEDVPSLKEKSTELVGKFQAWISEHINIGIRKQNQYIQDTKENLKEQAPQILGLTFASLIGALTYFILIPIQTFLILYYKSTIKKFLVSLFTNGSQEQVREVLDESTSVAQAYMLGLLIETTIVFTLNVIGFLILGIKYPVFLALLAAILNLVPYVGILVANVICMLTTLISSDNVSDAIWVGVILGLVQLFDNHFGMPLIVGTKVRINALATIVGVLLGGLLCGVPGMFLAIPGLAFLKVMFDKAPELKPWGLLLSDESASDSGRPGWKLWKRKEKKKENQTK